MNHCWSCQHESADLISLDGERGHLCDSCWKKLSVVQRVALQAFLKSRTNGGVGLRELLEQSDREDLIDSLFGNRNSGRN